MPSQYSVPAIIFDLDGTLVDSAEDLRAAVNLLHAEQGLRPIEAGEIKAMIGDGALKLVERALTAAGEPQVSATELLPRFLELYQANPATKTDCYPGVRQTLAGFAVQDLPMAVVTNKPVAATKAILKALSIAPYFTTVVGGDTLAERKPHPAPLLEAARRLRLDPAHLLMVGDNIHDVKAARAAGMRCIAVTYGYHHQAPASFGADGLIDTFNELLALVEPALPPAAKDGSALSASSSPS